ncbi:DUF6537 domain-containing protein, partial [Litorivivens sp.]|uniref:DUF6537 domain-containing protein n=1 Tax=Litorivivens sp. TaxID=2020868 RepID=UPI00356B1B5F
EGNLRTLNLGRLAAHDPQALAAGINDKPELVSLDSVDEVLANRTALLNRYQNETYAEDYRRFVERIRAQVNGIAGGEEFARQVALTLAKLMTYKDEYEVARLYSDPKFMARIREQFSGDFKLTLNLAPPILPGRDKATGRPRKREFGPWILSALRLLAKMKRLRGTAFDIFGYFPERRMERRLISDYRALITETVGQITVETLPIAIELAAAARDIGGYGPVKDASVTRYREVVGNLRAALHNPPQAQAIELKVTQL